MTSDHDIFTYMMMLNMIKGCIAWATTKFWTISTELYPITCISIGC